MSTYLVTTDEGLFETYEVAKEASLFTDKRKGGMLYLKQFLPVKDLSGQPRIINLAKVRSFAANTSVPPTNKESTPKNG